MFLAIALRDANEVDRAEFTVEDDAFMWARERVEDGVMITVYAPDGRKCGTMRRVG